MPDTAEKRRAAAGVGPVGGPGVTPNADKDAEWRAQVAGGYVPTVQEQTIVIPYLHEVVRTIKVKTIAGL